LLDLNGLGIRELKKLAQTEKRVKSYSKFTKPELVERLTPFKLTQDDLAIALET
jgi:hypothetical protein